MHMHREDPLAAPSEMAPREDSVTAIQSLRMVCRSICKTWFHLNHWRIGELSPGCSTIKVSNNGKQAYERQLFQRDLAAVISIQDKEFRARDGLHHHGEPAVQQNFVVPVLMSWLGGSRM